MRLFELVLADGRSASPYVWRIRYALAHKGLTYESVPLGFSEIAPRFSGRFKTVPVFEHNGQMKNESWEIARYLDEIVPQKPLFSSDGEYAAARLFDSWFSIEIQRRMLMIYVLDVHNAARETDREYFRSSREARFNGQTLEAITAGREDRLPELRAALQPLRLQLARFPWLGGASPSYLDYIALGAFEWVGSVSTLPPLSPNDEVLDSWLGRGFDLYGGLGRAPLLRPLFA